MSADPVAEALHHAVYGFLVVGSRSAAGELDGMTANWGTQVSFEPRLYAVAIEQDARTRANIDATGVFAVSFMPGGTQELALRLSRHSTSGAGRLAGLAVDVHATGAPTLPQAVAWIECRVQVAHTVGDHVLFVGEVVGGASGLADTVATTLSALDLSYAG